MAYAFGTRDGIDARRSTRATIRPSRRSRTTLGHFDPPRAASVGELARSPCRTTLARASRRRRARGSGDVNFLSLGPSPPRHRSSARHGFGQRDEYPIRPIELVANNHISPCFHIDSQQGAIREWPGRHWVISLCHLPRDRAATPRSVPRPGELRGLAAHHPQHLPLSISLSTPLPEDPHMKLTYARLVVPSLALTIALGLGACGRAQHVAGSLAGPGRVGVGPQIVAGCPSLIANDLNSAFNLILEQGMVAQFRSNRLRIETVGDIAEVPLGPAGACIAADVPNIEVI